MQYSCCWNFYSIPLQDAGLHFHFSLSCTGEGNGNPLQCSCLENPRTGESGGLPSMGSHRVRYEWSDAAAVAAQDAALSTRIQCWYKDFTFLLTFKNCICVFFGCTGALFLHRLFSSCSQKGYSLLIVVVHGILIARSTWSTGSRVQTL